MTELDLNTIIAQGSKRIRFQFALQKSLNILGLSLLVASFIIFLSRYQTASSLWTHASIVFIPTSTVCAFIVAYLSTRPSPISVALCLDSRAKTAEHLTTWLELSQRIDTEFTPLQRDFKNAQRNSAILHCATLYPTQLIPMRFPAWARSIWLAILLVLCALLMPEQTEIKSTGPRQLLNPDPRLALALQNATGGDADGEKNASDLAPHIEPFSKTDMLALKLQFCNEQLSPEAREKLLKDLETKIGDTPRNALSQDLQEMLSTLQRESIARKTTKEIASEQSENASAQTSKSENQEPIKINLLPGKATIPETFEQAFTTVKAPYPDVREELERYYRQKSTLSEPTDPRRP